MPHLFARYTKLPMSAIRLLAMSICISIFSVALSCSTSSDSFPGDLDFAGDEDLSETNEIDGEIDMPDSDPERMEETEGSPNVCALAEAELGYRVCSHVLEDRAAFDDFALGDDSNSGIDALTKYLLPATVDAPLPLMFQDVHRFTLHFDFLRTVFPALYGSLTAEGYSRLVLDYRTRKYWAGAALAFTESCKGHNYGFTIYQDRRLSEALSAQTVMDIQKRLGKALPESKPLYFPATLQDQDDAESWPENSVEIYDCGEPIDFEAYNHGIAVGYVRLFDAAAFSEASRNISYGWQDILVLETAPFDIETVTAAIVTGERQTLLSHINVRASRRGTPNLFVRNALDAFEAYEGRLIRLTVNSGGYIIEDNIDEEEAIEHWEANRPSLDDVVLPDWEYREFPSLIEVPVENAEQREAAFSRFGGKGANLAILAHHLDSEHMVEGFLIPFGYYEDFMQSNFIEAEIGGVLQTRSYETHILAMTGDADFMADPAIRRNMLDTLSEEMRRNGVVDRELVTELSSRIVDVFGSGDRMVRFRSSSNIEDSLEFSGAGLYASRSACAADMDPNSTGSLCDAGRDDPRMIEDALRRVWASFWEPRAFEERLYYQFIDPTKTAMGIAVTPAFLDEAANGVVFTGLPQIVGDRRMQVNAQIGEVSVVSPPPGILPESTLLTVEGNTVTIERGNRSSLVTPPAVVLSDNEYTEMGLVLDDLRESFPFDIAGYRPEEVVLDLEFKITADDRLMFKQVRPFLRLSESIETDRVQIDIENGAMLCGRFQDNRELLEEYELRTKIELVAESFSLPTEGELPTQQLTSKILFGPQKTELSATSAPQWTCETADPGYGTTYYRYVYRQSFSGDGKEFSLSWEAQTTAANGQAPSAIKIGEAQIAELGNGWRMRLGIGENEKIISLLSCRFNNLPRFKRTALLPSGDRIELDLRFRQSLMGSGPAGLLGATFIGQDRQIFIDDYFRLVYSADHHNWKERFLMVTPDIDPGIWAIAIRESFPYDPSQTVVEMLNDQGEVIERIIPIEYTNEPVED